MKQREQPTIHQSKTNNQFNSIQHQSTIQQMKAAAGAAQTNKTSKANQSNQIKRILICWLIAGAACFVVAAAGLTALIQKLKFSLGSLTHRPSIKIKDF